MSLTMECSDLRYWDLEKAVCSRDQELEKLHDALEEAVDNQMESMDDINKISDALRGVSQKLRALDKRFYTRAPDHIAECAGRRELYDDDYFLHRQFCEKELADRLSALDLAGQEIKNAHEAIAVYREKFEKMNETSRYMKAIINVCRTFFKAFQTYGQEKHVKQFCIPDKAIENAQYEAEHPLVIQEDHKLGSGGCGSVYASQVPGGDVVLKVSKGDQYDFKREIAMQACLDHPHIVSLEGCSAAKGASIIIQERADTDLFEYVWGPKAKQLSAEEYLKLVKQIASALAYMHENGFVHHDVKSENILVFIDEHRDLLVKLGDFGCTRDISEHTPNGTLAYASPYKAAMQLAKDYQPPCDPSHYDVWAFGVTLFEMLFDKRPFGYDTDVNETPESSEIYRKKLAGYVPDPEANHVSDACIEELLKDFENKRYSQRLQERDPEGKLGLAIMMCFDLTTHHTMKDVLEVLQST